MRTLAKTICLSLLTIGAAAAPVSAEAATTFNIQFDSQGLVPGDGPLIPPIVGTGTFISPIDLIAGNTYDLSALAGFSVSFSFTDGQAYSTGDINTPLTGAAVRIADLGGGVERLFFTEGSGAGQDGGSQAGSLDLTTGSGFLTFEPSFFGGNFLFQEQGPNSLFQGRYLAVSGVPEASTWTMMLLGFGAIGFALRRRGKKLAFAAR
jgi:hypothetical protein